MKHTRSYVPMVFLALILSSLCPTLYAQSLPETGIRLAVLSFENTSGDFRQDYLAALAEGILRYDLSMTAGIPMVERQGLDRVLTERELSLSGLQEGKSAARAGDLLGATHLILGEYAVLSGEFSLTVHLVETATGAAVTFRDRGVSEHVVHRLAEKIAAKLLDRRGVVFADASNDRSILTLRDETPGTIALYSPIRAAEIYLDGEFQGYTKGDALDPILLDSVRPGRHSLRVHLSGGDFGIVLLPQVEFKDWEAVVDVRPGGRHALRDQTRHFNEVLYRLEYLYSVELKAPIGSASSLAASRELSFTDRSGRAVPVSFSAIPSESAAGVSVAFVFKVGDEKSDGVVVFPEQAGIPSKILIKAGLASLEAEIYGSSGVFELDIRVRRTDVYQGMHREK